jgi:hypothetical protein
MRALVFASMLAFAGPGSCSDQASAPTPSSAPAAQGKPNDWVPPESTTPAPSEVGRYTIIHSPQIESDTILLDTVTGRTWQLQKAEFLNGDPLGWQEIYRFDDPGALATMGSLYGYKKKEAPPPPVTLTPDH